MIVFIVPLKSPRIAHCRKRLFRLLERSLFSICRQTDPRFAVMLVCNECPAINFSHPSICHCTLDLPLPENTRDAMNADKLKKIRAGFERASRFNPSHVMVVDADDCVSDKIAALVAGNSSAPGWIITRGYLCRDGRKLAYLNVKNFNESCGSSVIIRTDLFNNLTSDDVYYDHELLQLPPGEALQPLPFPGAVYVIENGENIFMNSARIGAVKAKETRALYYLRKSLKYRPRLVTASMRTQFGYYPLDVEADDGERQKL